MLSLTLAVGCGDANAKKASAINTPRQGSEQASGPGVAAMESQTAQPQQAGGGTAANQAPSSAEEAAPPPTVFAARELAKVLDFTKLPAPEGAEIGQSNPAHLEAKVPGQVPATAAFYQDKMAALGWNADDGPGKMVSDDYASMRFKKDGHVAFMSIIKFGKNKPECNVTLWFYGNFDTRTLPRSEGAKLTYGSQTQTMYTSSKKVPAEADWVAKALASQGWQTFAAFNTAMRQSDDQRVMNLRRQGYTLDVLIGSAPAQGNQTSVSYMVRALGHELPAPAAATKVEFDDDQWKMQCETPGTLEATAEFYRTAMPAAGYKPLAGETPQERYVNLRFGTAAGDIVLVQVSKRDAKSSKVLIVGTPAAVLEKLRKEEEKKSSTAK
ncbi:MAG TPA: hypothetical protein VG099_20935 [Gemmataceae bacterium]|jgi:hypothetical protein|nr:hypothetical protein [Gemmataceae bacterium]